MAKKFVRGITDVKTITNQCYDTNNVNDLLSDGQYNYIHRKKGKTEEYHNLTDNIKTVSSDNTELLSVTNNNKTTNTATLHPKHDAQKEQVLESTRNTISIHHGTNGTAEKTTVDTNPQKVLEHENLTVDYGISKTTSGNTTKLALEYTKVEQGFDLNNLQTANVRGERLVNAPNNDILWFLVSSKALGGDNYVIQEATTVLYTPNRTYRRTKKEGVWGEWREQVGDKSVIDSLLAQKQDTLVAGSGITIQGNTISATGGTSSTIQKLDKQTDPFTAIKHVVTSGQQKLTTFVFQCHEAESVLTADLIQQLENYFPTNKTISNGAVSIANDGTNIKLINNAPSQNVSQQGTFTFHDYGGGGRDVPPGV